MVDLSFVLYFLLIFARIIGLFLPIPIFGNRNVPNIMKIGFIFFITLVIYPTVEYPTLDFKIFESFIMYLTLEFMIGVAIGMVASLGMNFVYIAGVLVDRNIGFAMVSVISPQDENQLPVSANFYYLFALIILLVSNLHHRLIQAIVYSYDKIPLGSIFVLNRLIPNYINILSDSFKAGIQIAAPFLITIFVANILLGLLSKAMPGMNVFMIGMPLKVFVGLFVFNLLIPYYYSIFENLLGAIVNAMYGVINVL